MGLQYSLENYSMGTIKTNPDTTYDNLQKVSLPKIESNLGPDVLDIRKLYSEQKIFTYDPGFTSTASCKSKITFIDGEKGILLHRGYKIEELAKDSSFLEVAYLLLEG